MRVILTGGSGFIGNHLLRKLLRRSDAQVLLLARRPHPLYHDSSRLEEYLFNSVADLNQTRIAGWKPDAIVHLAAVSSPGECQANRSLAEVVNVSFTEWLSRVADISGAKLIFSSTDWVFELSSPPEGGFIEEDSVAPSSVYSCSKVRGEQAVLAVGGTVARLSITYGPEIGGRKSFLSWMLDGLMGGKEVTLFSDEWRTPILVDDVITAIELLIASSIGGVFHLGGPQRISRSDFGAILARIINIPVERVLTGRRGESPTNPERPADLSLNSSKFEKIFDCRFKSPEAGLDKIISAGASSGILE